jgi:hypothetical protein
MLFQKVTPSHRFGEIVTYPITPGARLAFDFSPDDLSMSFNRDGDNLHIDFENGGTVVLGDFFAYLEGNQPPVLVFPDAEVGGLGFLQAYAPDLAPAAAGTAGGGINDYTDDAGALTGGLESLEGQGVSSWAGAVGELALDATKAANFDAFLQAGENAGGGNYTLYGGEGNDILIGGGGNDVFYFAGGMNSGVDSILDFVVGEDRITIEGLFPDWNSVAGDLLDGKLSFSMESDHATLAYADGLTSINVDINISGMSEAASLAFASFREAYAAAADDEAARAQAEADMLRQILATSA